MTTIQESKLNMFLALRNFLNANVNLTKDLPNFSTTFSVLLETINQIQTIGEMQKADKTGITMEKNRLKKTLISMATDCSRKLTAYARFTGNDTLLNEARFTPSEFERMTDVALRDYLKILYSKAESNIDKLAEYGITAETQKTFIETITAYNTSLSTPRTGITEKVKATKKLTDLFAAADLAVENMDYAVGIIQLTQPDFFTGYKSSRKILATSTNYLALKATAKDTATGEPVRGVVFVFDPADGKTSAGGNGQIIKKTAEKGNFNIRNMATGDYNVLIRKPGYKDKQISVSVAPGERCDINVEIEKA
jgi:hypothetical protein